MCVEHEEGFEGLRWERERVRPILERFGSGGEREIDVLGMNFIEEVDVAPQLLFILLLKKGLKIMD